MSSEDETLAYLLDLDGEEIIYDGGHVARFTVKRIAATPEKPHGVSYSLTFHAADGRRLMGYDNAHAVPHRAVGLSGDRRRSIIGTVTKPTKGNHTRL
jgi:hypothetical protein